MKDAKPKAMTYSSSDNNGKAKEKQTDITKSSDTRIKTIIDLADNKIERKEYSQEISRCVRMVKIE